MTNLKSEEIAEIIECLKFTDFTEVRLSYSGVELWVTRVPEGLSVRQVDTWIEADPAAEIAATPTTPIVSATPPVNEAAGVTQAAAPDASGIGADIDMAANIALVNSPMLGTFYVSPSPSDPPFVKVGDRVEAGAIVGIVEAMKLMTQVHSDVTGEVVEVLVANEELVEFGHPLMKIRTA